MIERAVSPGWEDTADFLKSVDADEDTVERFEYEKKAAEVTSDGERMGKYPVLYLEPAGRNRSRVELHVEEPGEELGNPDNISNPLYVNILHESKIPYGPEVYSNEYQSK